MCFLALSHQYSTQQSLQLDKIRFELTTLDIKPVSLQTEIWGSAYTYTPFTVHTALRPQTSVKTFRIVTVVLDRTIPD